MVSLDRELITSIITTIRETHPLSDLKNIQVGPKRFSPDEVVKALNLIKKIDYSQDYLDNLPKGTPRDNEELGLRFYQLHKKAKDMAADYADSGAA